MYDPARPGEAITDIDHIEGDVLWEVKTAVDAVDRMTGKDGTARWIRDKVTGKADRYVRARAHIPGYEDADIGFRFMTPGADPAFQAAVNAEIARLRTVYPAITWLIEWR
ncbi:MAG: hypothetical protein MUD01_23230 [Chloroflexaceae bacterium]|nr:hypothetical protein [Chloroflexaceae bacterium]